MTKAKYLETFCGNDYFRDLHGNIYTKVGNETAFCSNMKQGHLTENKAEPSYPVSDVELIKEWCEMNVKQTINLIDEYLKEDCTNAEWVECLEVCKTALNKQVPRKVVYPECDTCKEKRECISCGNCNEPTQVTCPNCLNEIEDNFRTEYAFCPKCGQNLDWSKNDA